MDSWQRSRRTMKLEFNAAEAEKERLKELWQTFKSGAVGIVGDAQRLLDFVAEVETDFERKNDLIGALTAGGQSLVKVKNALKGVKRIKEAIEAEGLISGE